MVVNNPHIIVITGPTASGKSDLAVRVALELNADVISADSRQIYRGIPITTAVPPIEHRKEVKHHLIEAIDLDQTYSAASFSCDAHRIINDAQNHNVQFIVVCGGSMMYIDALLYGLDDIPTINQEVRKRVNDLFNQVGLEGLNAYLSYLDPDLAERIDRQNTRRVMHAVEICLQTGQPASMLYSQYSGASNRHLENAEQTAKPNTSSKFQTYSKFILQPDREVLFARINDRVDKMVQLGMEDEAQRVYPLRHLNSLNTIGFKEWFAHFDGKMDKKTTIERIAKNTRVYAKKQMLWLSGKADNIYLDQNPDKAFRQILSQIEVNFS